MTTDNRTNEQIVAEELSYVPDECSCHRSTAMDLARDAVAALTEAGRLAGEQLSGNTGQFTEAQVEAATEAMEDYYDRWSGPGEQSPTYAEFAEVALVAAQGAAPQATVDDLIETKVGLLIAHSAFDEGASAMLHSVNQTQSGDEWSRPENPYWKALGPVLTAERASTAKPKSPKDIHEPSHDRVYCVRCGGNWPCQTNAGLPSGGVDEDALAEVVALLSNHDLDRRYGAPGTPWRCICKAEFGKMNGWKDHRADAILALLAGLAEGGNNEKL